MYQTSSEELDNEEITTLPGMSLRVLRVQRHIPQENLSRSSCTPHQAIKSSQSLGHSSRDYRIARVRRHSYKRGRQRCAKSSRRCRRVYHLHRQSVRQLALSPDFEQGLHDMCAQFSSIDPTTHTALAPQYRVTTSSLEKKSGWNL